MKAAVIGSRKFFGYSALATVLSQYPITHIVSGGAKGPDKMSEQWAEAVGLPTPTIFLPNWDLHGKAAGFIRNKYIVDAADCVIAFWDGKSRGTVDSIKHAIKTKKPVHVWLVDLETQEVVRLLGDSEYCQIT